MKTIKINKKGFTILELVLVMAIIVILLGMAMSYYRGQQVGADIDTQAANIVHYLRLAQSKALSGLNDKSQGIHFETADYTLFQGDIYNPESSDNYKITFPTSLIVNNISLNGGGSDVIYSKTTGETANFGSITLFSASISKEIPITITAVGTVNY